MELVIVLSTYSGDKYLRAHLHSILEQSILCGCLLIRDDGSHNATLSILHEFADQYSNIKIYQDSLGHIGIHRSYSLLLQPVISYIMLADQDDIWLKDKTTKSLNLIPKQDESKSMLVLKILLIPPWMEKKILSLFLQYK